MMASQFVIESIVRAVMKEMVRESQKGSLSQTKTLYIPTGVSNRHVHLSQEHANILFGKGKVFKKLRDLSQPGQCVYEETVNLAGPIGFFTNVRILGPVREQTQVELLAGDCIILGIDAPIRESGKLAESGGGLSITGPNGCVWLKEGVIIAKRHIHMHTTDAERFNVVDGEEVKSIGIDIGTTTTKLVVSEIYLENRLPGSMVPSITICGKKILYESNVYFTPLIDRKTIDSKKIKEIIDKEYQEAGIRHSDIDTGAIIITGETAKRENAKSILQEISNYAGDFVVAIAGPEMESVLAGKGSGALEFSRERHETVANIDIGGGTANIAIFDDGEVVDATCISIGGRMIEVDGENLFVRYKTAGAAAMTECLGIPLHIGDKITEEIVCRVTNKAAEVIREIIRGEELSETARALLATRPLKQSWGIDSVVFSGGVAGFVYDDTDKCNFADCFTYGDIGIFLGRAIKRNLESWNVRVLKSVQTIRATVVGVGAQSMSISGSTSFIDKELLPLKNVLIGRVIIDNVTGNEDNLTRQIRETLDRMACSVSGSHAAIAIAQRTHLKFRDIELLAKSIFKGWKSSCLSKAVLVIILDKDYAKVLGQSISKINNGAKEFICIDLIPVGDGDYVDIGKPIPGEDAVPVIVKTLIFSTI